MNISKIIIIFFRRKYSDKAEATPFLSSALNGSPSMNNQQSCTSTVNRTLLHHQQNHGVNGSVRKTTSGTLRGLALSTNIESPPPEYNLVHDTRHEFFVIFSFILYIYLYVGCRFLHTYTTFSFSFHSLRF